MKVVIDQKVLTKALERGAAAALSDEAQGDSSAFAPLIKSVRITIDEKNMTIESFTSLMATKHVTEIKKNCGIEVKNQGTVLVPAKEILGWVSRQNKSKVAMSLTTLATPEIISESDDSELSTSTTSVKKIGQVKLVSQDESKTGSKWNVPCYDSTPLTYIDFDSKPKSFMTIPNKQLGDSLKNVTSAILPKDYQHIFDSIAIESHKGNIYMAGSDLHRCSIYKLDQAQSVDKDFFVETKKNAAGTKLDYGQKVLIPCSPLREISKKSEDVVELSFHYDVDKGKVYISQENWDVRLATPDVKMFDKFPSVFLLLGKKFAKLGSVPKEILFSRLVSASLVNKASVLFDFNKDKSSLVIHAISEGGHSPSSSSAPVRHLAKDVKMVWGVQHITDVLKILKDEDVNIMVADDMRSMKVVSEEDPNLSYYAMSVVNPIYAALQDK